MAKKQQKNNHKSKDSSGLFIPAGLLTGMGIGFLVNNVPTGLFIGLGVGFCFNGNNNTSK